MYMLKQIKFKQIIKISVRVNCEDRLLIEDVIYLFLFFLKLKNEKLNVNTFKGIKNRERKREKQTFGLPILFLIVYVVSIFVCMVFLFSCVLHTETLCIVYVFNDLCSIWLG